MRMMPSQRHMTPVRPRAILKPVSAMSKVLPTMSRHTSGWPVAARTMAATKPPRKKKVQIRLSQFDDALLTVFELERHAAGFEDSALAQMVVELRDRIDAIYNPVRRANFAVTETRVGQRTDYDKLIVEVWTDGRIDPKQARVMLVEAGPRLLATLPEKLSAVARRALSHSR